ncbi:hypothetical protein Tco_1535458 [Tanacetum coccineum]
MVEQLEAPVKNRLSSRAPSWFLGKQVLGKVGLLIDEVKFGTDVFQLRTKKVQDVVGTTQGIKLDMQNGDDMPLLRTITDIFGQSIWFKAIVVLTHAATAPPEGPKDHEER